MYFAKINPIQEGPFQDCSQMMGAKTTTLLAKVGNTYPTVMKLGIVIQYLKKIQKTYKSRDTPLEFC